MTAVSTSTLLRPLQTISLSRLRLLVLLVCGLLLLWLATKLFWRIYEARHWQPAAASEHSAPVLMRKVVDISALIDQHLFGDAVAPVAQSQDIAETTMPLKLVGVYGANDEGKASAIIESGGSQAVVFINEAMPAGSGVLKQVFADRIVFDRSGRLETLRMEDSTAQLAGQLEQAGNIVETGQLLDHRKDAFISAQMRNLRQDLNTNPAKLADIIQIQPFYAGSKLQGYRLSPGKDRKLFARAGLQPGDIVQAVNGVALDDAAQAMAMMKDLQNASEVQLTLQRAGQPLSLMLPLGQ